MSFSLFYLVQRFFLRIYQFLRHWYVGSFWAIMHRTINVLESLDRTFALKINLRNIFTPLYQQYNIIGYILGFIFRSGRVIIASIIYLAILLAAILIYLAWAAVPIYVIYKGLILHGNLL